MTVDEAQEALLDHQSRPYDLWAAMRAIRGLSDAGFRAEAHAVATAFAERHRADERGGDGLLTHVQQAEIKVFQSGETLCDEGELDDQVFVILSGKARVRRLGVGELAHLPPGTVVGEIASVTGTARTATVEAESEVQALRFESKQLASLVKALPSAYVRLRETSRSRMLAQLMGPGSIFGNLGDGARAALFEQCLAITLPAGTEVISDGEVGRAMCIIASGFADVWVPKGSGEEVVARLGPGEVFGEMSLLYDRKASANVRATTVLTLFALDRPRFEKALGDYPHARDRVLRLAESRLGVKPGDGSPAMPVVKVVRTPPPIPQKP
ncbi:MAG: cyclic nucleotide-binding domain-containing protein [Myxococcales bacterium]|nr:cyclic nucleotide-binding domain-containing protein [Myxococcales bacterium]MCB9526396.1 cyclic nucleotide-binding domain-containing protein [Myxococcales bacterium]